MIKCTPLKAEPRPYFQSGHGPTGFRIKYLDIKYLDVEIICHDECSEEIKDESKSWRKAMEAMDTNGTHLWLVLWKAYDALHAHAAKSIESLDMCISDFGVLELLLHKGPAHINVLGEKLSLASGSITAAIDRLEQRGLVQRTPAPTDRRAKIVELTKTGKQLIQKSFARHSEDMDFAVEGLTKTQRLQLLELLKKLGKNAEQRLQC